MVGRLLLQQWNRCDIVLIGWLGLIYEKVAPSQLIGSLKGVLGLGQFVD